MAIQVGTPCPGFALPDTEGNTWDPIGGVADVIVFTCNHCPYALAWHDRLLDVARDYAGRGVRMLLICSNDGERYPHDSFDAMRERVAAEGPWPAPYLRDESQAVARAFGAEVTPDCFVFDNRGRLKWRGAPDGDYRDPTQNAAWLRDALDQVLAGAYFVDPPTRDVQGCSIKWREG
jgi:hypothetical protein